MIWMESGEEYYIPIIVGMILDIMQKNPSLL